MHPDVFFVERSRRARKGNAKRACAEYGRIEMTAGSEKIHQSKL